MNNNKIAKAAKAPTTIAMATKTAQSSQSNGRRLRPSHKSIDESDDKKLMKTQSIIAQKEKMVQEKKEKSVEKLKKSVVVHDEGKRKAEKRSIVTLQKKASSTANEPIKTNDAKRVPKSNQIDSGKSKNGPITKESTNKAKSTPKIKDAKTSSIKGATMPSRTSNKVMARPIVGAPISAQNVMNQVHNVTVSSPPSIRRDLKQDKEKPSTEKVEDVVKRDRTRTRTLEKSEVILLKTKDESTAQMETPEPLRMETSHELNALQRIDMDFRQPISFVVQFDDKKHKQMTKSTSLATDEDTADSYEDDFESYESDFEDDLSSSEANGSQPITQSERSSLSIGIDASSSESEMCEDSPIAKHPFEVNKIDEELDSGSYEMKPISSARLSQNEYIDVNVQRPNTIDVQHDSGIELLHGASNQFTNSGGGNGGVGPLSSLDINNSKTFDNISDIEIETAVNSLDLPTNGDGMKRKGAHSEKVAKLNRRGAELLKKITMDTMNYVLYDCQPIPYDLFMQIYGKNDTAQVSIQTHNTRTDQDTQSEPIELAEVWTQHPPTFYTRHMNTNDFSEYKNGCSACIHQPKTIESTLSNCVKRLQNYTMSTSVNGTETQISEINYDHLSRFLLANEITMSRIINDKENSDPTQFHDSMIPDSLGYFAIELGMKEFEVLRIFASPALSGFLFTLHQDIKGQLYVIAVWNLAFAKDPICLLSSWTAVLCLEVHANARDLVFAGLDDGSIAIWDYVEAKSWHPSLSAEDGAIKRIVPTQIVTPVAENTDGHIVDDIGHVVAIRSLYAGIDVELLNGYNPKQVCSLYVTGLLVLWSVLETSATNSNIELTEKRIDHQSEWSCVKLIQNKLVDLRPRVQSSTYFSLFRPNSSSFDKTRSYFESDLFNDAALQELQTTNKIEGKHLTNFRCVALELTHDGILIATNENFILFGRKTMRSETFQKLQIDTVGRTGRIDALLTLNIFEDDVVLATLRDGTIKSFCFDWRARKSDPLSDCGDEPSISSAYSLPPMPPASAGETSASSSISVASAGAFMIGHDMGKSCTIQSIVQCERKLYDEVQALNNLDMNEYKILFDGEDADGSLHKFTRFVNDQIVMSNSSNHFTGRRHQMVQLIKSNRLAMLHNGRLRLYKFRNSEISQVNSNFDAKLIEAATTIGDNDVEYLILLDENNEIQVHICTNNNNNNNNNTK